MTTTTAAKGEETMSKNDDTYHGQRTSRKQEKGKGIRLSCTQRKRRKGRPKKKMQRKEESRPEEGNRKFGKVEKIKGGRRKKSKEKDGERPPLLPKTSRSVFSPVPRRRNRHASIIGGSSFHRPPTESSPRIASFVPTARSPSLPPRIGPSPPAQKLRQLQNRIASFHAR